MADILGGDVGWYDDGCLIYGQAVADHPCFSNADWVLDCQQKSALEDEHFKCLNVLIFFKGFFSKNILIGYFSKNIFNVALLKKHLKKI